MDNASTFQGQPSYIGKTSNRKRLVTIFLVVFLLLIAGLGALYLLGTSAKHSFTPTNPVPTAIVSTPTPASTSAQLTATPSASPTSTTVNPAKLTVSVLNGSGIAGAADKMATSLKSAGYSNVTTGNANVFTYTGITLHVKKQEYLKQLEKDVATAAPNAKVTSGVDSSLTSDVEVIVGK